MNLANEAASGKAMAECYQNLTAWLADHEEDVAAMVNGHDLMLEEIGYMPEVRNDILAARIALSKERRQVGRLGEVITRSELIWRGWKSNTIKLFLPPPEVRWIKALGESVDVWDPYRVDYVEHHLVFFYFMQWWKEDELAVLADGLARLSDTNRRIQAWQPTVKANADVRKIRRQTPAGSNAEDHAADVLTDVSDFIRSQFAETGSERLVLLAMEKARVAVRAAYPHAGWADAPIVRAEIPPAPPGFKMRPHRYESSASPKNSPADILKGFDYMSDPWGAS